ncbi:hypothetical protein H2198_000470 [Neophaeococcomyces mojaviensis]|uniref:Uncharacterized protein n=1 Tax=Neophaeococcomyces mojaviensis TaxID=3383035 RepID=A0ACC3AJJ1_9EURO|nr:hypothetical protein H2198_000470 [Knufia sp. JES_112]
MPRYINYDDDSDDESRLPEGFQRIGYDADTREYTFKAPNGQVYKSSPGNRYGPLFPTSAYVRPDYEVPVADNRVAWRYMLPFFVLVFVFLLFLIAPPRWIWSGNGNIVGGDGAVECGDGAMAHVIRKGDTCWDISKKYGTSVEILETLNPDLNCDSLQVGSGVCVPKSDVI